MINLRYHIISLTAVFLAIGIGLTLGSTFLDRATVGNLSGRLETLETRLGDRDEDIRELGDTLDQRNARQQALDEQSSVLLTGWLDGTSVVVVSARGADEGDIEQTVTSLVESGASVQGVWWLTERWALEDDGAVSDLAEALGEDSSDPSRLRRTAITRLGGDLRARQLLAAEEPGTDGDGTTDDTTEDTSEDTTADGTGGDAASTAPILDALVEAGFIEFDAVSEGPETPVFPDGARIVFAAGSPDVPDDLVLEPLVARMARASDTPLLGVIGSALPENGLVADAVAVIRQDENLRAVVSTVDDLEHFEGRAAAVIALAQLDQGIVGHYGLDESASRLLPALPGP